jgi:hypothetical protein
MSATTNILGSGLKYPFRQGKGGLPDLEFGLGVEMVKSVIDFLLRTSRGEIPFDPALGADPEQFRYRQTDLRSQLDLRDAMEQGLLSADPRLVSTSVFVEAQPSDGTMSAAIEYDVIREQTADNRVRLPVRGHDDVLRETDDGRRAIFGYHDSLLMGISTG